GGGVGGGGLGGGGASGGRDMSRRPWWGAARSWRSVPHLCGERLDVRPGPRAEGRYLDVEPAPVADELEQRAVDPVHDRAVVLARAVEPGVVLGGLGEEEIVAEEPAERVQQRQGALKAGQGPVAGVHPDVAAAAQERPQDLPGQRGRDLVGV